MMQFSIHTKGLIFAIAVISLGAVIVRTGIFLSVEMPKFLIEENSIETDGNKSLASIPKTPLLRRLNDSAVIYSHQTDTLTKKDALIASKQDFIFVDITRMSLDVYQSGELIKTFPIKAIGREGTFFETPNGSYTVLSKETNHFSTIGEVWMPWSMHFFGNYFIHGWPYYPNGTPVAETYSGGCIRLSTDDARELFNLVKPKMGVIVYTKKDATPTQENYFKKIPLFARAQGKRDTPIGLSARSVLAADFETGQILFEKQKNEVHPIASVTKLMTGLVALESIDRFKSLTIDETAEETSGDTGRVRTGDIFRSQDLLYPLILASSNDVATLYAEQVFGFISLMNEKAKAINLTNTFFKDPTGLSPENVSTVEDLFKLLKYISRHKRSLFTTSGLGEYTLVSGTRRHTWKNSTWPNNDGIFLGGKFGFTSEAGQTLAAVFAIKLSEKETRPVGIILLGSQDRKRDVMAIKEYLERNFVYGSVLVEKDPTPLFQNIHVGASVFEALKERDEK